VLALSYGSRQILERLGAWGRFDATPIETIHISHQGGFGRTVIRAGDYGLPALGYVTEAAAVASALQDTLARRGIEARYDSRVESATASATDVVLRIDGPDGTATLNVMLVAHVEGSADGEGLLQRDYAQQAVITVVRTAEPHRGLAYERFTPQGPLALLPHRDRYAVVYTAPTAAAQRLLELDDDAFLQTLQAHFGTRLSFVSAAPRAAFPLALRARREPVATRCVWLGNSAQTLHPVAGQGFNLALRDVWSLAELLREPMAADPGQATVLARYAATRRMDRGSVIGFTDTLIRVFGSGNPLLAAARGGGLALLDILPPLREFVAKRMIFGARAWP
jgi:2-octaprenyl-6-methoxyphenol hydroxylase